MPQIPAANPSNSGKKSRSTIAPATKNAILAKRANGQSKLSIAKDLRVAPGTVRKVLDEADFNQLIQQGRSDCAGLLSEAIQGLKRAFERSEGATCCRFLEGMGVLGEDKSRRNRVMQRLGEMYSLTWDGVNLSRRVLTIPRSKNGETRHIPLNSAASPL